MPASKSPSSLESINPSTGKVLQAYTPFQDRELESRVRGSEKLWESWRLQPLSRREALLDALVANLLKKKEKLSLLITQEMGKPLNQSIQEIEKCQVLCRYYKEYARAFLKPREEFLSYKKSYVYHAPLGGILGIMPWNFPFWQVFRFAIPALISGNAVFLKHAENVTGCSLALEDLFVESGWPLGIFNSLPIKISQIEKVVQDPFIKVVTFTGSTRAGREVASLCGKHLKKSILELGGSDPYIVLADADLQKAARNIVASRFNNSGQSCIAAKRVIVESSVYEDFCFEVVRLMEAKTIFNPIYNPDIGPVAKKSSLKTLEDFKKQAQDQGAEVLFSRASSDDVKSGFYFPITILGNCHASMALANEEVFGPLLPIFPVDDERKALNLANRSNYGLGACIFTRNKEKGELLARDHLVAGSCFVNSQVKSNPALPFGGINHSGYGRELSVEGIKEFVNIKTVVVS